MNGWIPPAGYRVFPPKVNIYREVVERPIERGHGDRLAIISEEGQWTYAKLSGEVAKIAAGLRALGIARGSPLIFRSPNTLASCATLLAAFKVGAVPVLTSSLLKPEELEYIQENCEARIAVTSTALAPPLEEMKRDGRIDTVVLLDTEDASSISYSKFRHAAGEDIPTEDTDALEPALLLYSSGTTGRPKGIVHGHKWIFAMGDIIQLQMQYKPGDVVMTPGEYSFMATWGHCLMAPLANGATVALFSGRPSPDAVLRSIKRFGVTKFMSVPTFYRTLLAQPDTLRAHDLSSVRLWVSGGELLGATTHQQWDTAVGSTLHDMYGISEAEVLIANGPAHPVKPGSIGKTFPGLKIALLDANLNEVAVNQPGRLMVHRSDPGMFLGYHKQWEKWRLAHRGEWYDTGDVMHRDEDGYYWYHGRQDDLFKTRGMFVSPQEIEDVLSKHSAVAEVAVTGAADERIGNRVCAFVVLKPDWSASEALEEEIRRDARKFLADYKIPHEIRFLERLPKNVVGKIVRRLLPVHE